MNFARGFTLIELLAVLGVLGVLCSLAFPAFGFLIEKEKAGAVSYNLYHQLNYARSEAIDKNITVSVCATKNTLDCSKNKDWSNQHILIFTDFNANGKRDDNDGILRGFDLGLDNNSLIWRSFGNKNYLQWQPSGMTYFQNGNFTYCPANKDARNARKIILNAAGRIYFGFDHNKDGIQEGADGKNIVCV